MVHKRELIRDLIPKIKDKRVITHSPSFIAETKDCLHSWFRTGGAITGNGAPEFIKECFSRLPKRVWRVFVRAESGFFNGALLDVLFDTKSEYLIKVNMKNLASLKMLAKMTKSDR